MYTEIDISCPLSRSLCGGRRSAGGMEGEAGQSVTAWGINVGNKLASGVSKFYTNIFTSSPRPSSGLGQQVIVVANGDKLLQDLCFAE